VSPVGDPRLTKAGLVQARVQAAQDWSLALGDSTSCAETKEGRAHPAGKFHEGRVAALSELSRDIADDCDAGRIIAGAAVVRMRWAGRVRPGARRDRDWDAYRAGGIQAMTEINARQGTAS